MHIWFTNAQKRVFAIQMYKNPYKAYLTYECTKTRIRYSNAHKRISNLQMHKNES